MKIALLTLFLSGLLSCAPLHSFKRDRKLFEQSAVTMKFIAVADMNDSYFEIRENNFFEFYRQLFDSVKNTQYPGTYTRTGDTLLLNFYDKKGIDILGTKAWLNPHKKEIRFFK
ncbi:MAG: hypothetical protein JWQ27_1249 [Ferruginibacter sp.]|nr:hypothetical protein [Ferruginibacter sp.]